MKTPKFLAHIIDKNGVATKRHKNATVPVEASRKIPTPRSSTERNGLPSVVRMPPEPDTEADAEKHRTAANQIYERGASEGLPSPRRRVSTSFL